MVSDQEDTNTVFLHMLHTANFLQLLLSLLKSSNLYTIHSPQQIDDAIASGVTTMFGGGTGPSAGTSATTCTPAPAQFEMMLQATDHLPLNFGFSGKGNTSDPSVLYDSLLAGACGFKLHEDWGTTPSAIDSCLTFCEENDVAVTIHTDTLNESGFIDDSIAAMKGRTIHTYHTEGAGGGHAPDIM